MGKTLPCVRDYDNHVYLRRWKDSFLMGAFEPKARAWKVGDALRPRSHTPGVENDWTEINQEHWYAENIKCFLTNPVKVTVVL